MRSNLKVERSLLLMDRQVDLLSREYSLYAFVDFTSANFNARTTSSAAVIYYLNNVRCGSAK